MSKCNGSCYCKCDECKELMCWSKRSLEELKNRPANPFLKSLKEQPVIKEQSETEED